MFRRWKENGRKALLTMQAAVLSGMMTICSYAETVQDANWMKEDATSGGLFTEAITKVQDVFRSGYAFAIVVAAGCEGSQREDRTGSEDYHGDLDSLRCGTFCTALYLCRRKTVIW